MKRNGMRMQPEHIAFAFGRIAMQMALDGLTEGYESVARLATNEQFLHLFANLLNDAKENEAIDQLISDRIIAEKKAAH